MINIKETIELNNLTQYRFAKIIKRQPAQIWLWFHGKRTISDAVSDQVKARCLEYGLEIVEK